MQISSRNKYSNVGRALRSDIVRGVFQPGHRLPTRSEMGRQFGVGVATVQKALDQLADDGFVLSYVGRGTFVADHPPHLCDFALVIPFSSRWSSCCEALLKASEVVGDEESVRFREYYSSQQIGARGEMARLRKDVRHHRLAGIIVAGPADDLAGTVALEEPGIPRVLYQKAHGVDCPVIQFDGGSFLDLATEYLYSKGRHRIAHLCLDYACMSMEASIAELRARISDVRSYWVQLLRFGERLHGTKHVVELLMQLEGDKRPDGLIIHDDNLLEQATAGLVAAGVKIPEELEVVAHANFPSQLNSAVPIKRIGFDWCELLSRTLELLEIQMRGGKPPKSVLLGAKSEEDLLSGVQGGRVLGMDGVGNHPVSSFRPFSF